MEQVAAAIPVSYRHGQRSTNRNSELDMTSLIALFQAARWSDYAHSLRAFNHGEWRVFFIGNRHIDLRGLGFAQAAKAGIEVYEGGGTGLRLVTTVANVAKFLTAVSSGEVSFIDPKPARNSGGASVRSYTATKEDLEAALEVLKAAASK